MNFVLHRGCKLHYFQRRSFCRLISEEDDGFAVGTGAMVEDGLGVIHKMATAVRANQTARASEPNEGEFDRKGYEHGHGAHGEQKKKRRDDTAGKRVQVKCEQRPPQDFKADEGSGEERDTAGYSQPRRAAIEALHRRFQGFAREHMAAIASLTHRGEGGKDGVILPSSGKPMSERKVAKAIFTEAKEGKKDSGSWSRKFGTGARGERRGERKAGGWRLEAGGWRLGCWMRI
jgi:hypothetical protein